MVSQAQEQIIERPITVLDRAVNAVWSLMQAEDQRSFLKIYGNSRAIAAIATFLTNSNPACTEKQITDAAYDAQGYNSRELSVVLQMRLSPVEEKSAVRAPNKEKPGMPPLDRWRS
jgi:hypothetical protein